MINNKVYPIQIEKGSFIVVLGIPGSGKSTFCGKLLGGFSGSRLYVTTSEEVEYVGKRMKKTLGKIDEDILITDYSDDVDVITSCRQGEVRHLLIDSRSSIGIDFLDNPRDFIKILNLTSLTMIIRPLKTKLHHSKEYTKIHESDITVICNKIGSKYSYTLEKCRFGYEDRNGKI